MSAVTVQEIVEALRELSEHEEAWHLHHAESHTLRLIKRIEQHGIAPPDGLVLVKDNPVAWWNGEGKICKQAVKDFDAKTGGTASIGFDIPLYAAAPEVKP